MQKFTLSICCFSALLIIGLSSCKDDEPYVPANLSVNTETVTILESGGTASIEIILDKAAPSDITVEYDLGGTALSPADYSVSGTEGELDIPQGQTSGTIEIDIVNDAVYEGDETIEITIQDVNTEDVVITNDDEALVTITEDDPQVQLSMAVATVAANEDDDELIVEVTLSSPAPQAITVEYTLTGTALDTVAASMQTPQPIPPQFWDYYIDTPTSGELVIPQGATKGEIAVQILTDFQFEDPETIIITLDAATNATITANKTTTVTVQQQNGKIIALVWDDAYTDVDMDLFLWIGDDVSDLFFIASSTNPSVTQRVEALIIPNNVDGVAFGTSYTYYEGTATPMEFEAHFADFTDGVIEPLANRDIYPASYTLANINKWDDDGAPEPAIAQTFEKAAGQFVNVTTPIVVPASGSRLGTVALPKEIKKTRTTSSRLLKRIR